MQSFTSSQIDQIPDPAHPDQMATGLERWLEAAEQAGQKEAAELALVKPGFRRLMECVFGGSPYLTRIATRDIEFTTSLASSDPETAFSELLTEITAGAEVPDQKALSKRLRLVKRRASLLIAMADLAGLWPLHQVTSALSDLAEASLEACVQFVIQDLISRKRLEISLDEMPAAAAGYVLLGMGKFGATELNYSSDIDLIALYDPEKLRPTDPDRLRQDMVRATQTIVTLMEERTGEGFVFRTDLRLRPDPSVTPIAVTVSAAMDYYESVGQNWERAAMIKARPVAGDRALGGEFLRHIKPFIWRKHLDFAAVADIHSIKRQINAHRGGSEIAMEGHNIKLGRGGIREIEFYVQTQQLIWGGRLRALRPRRTLDGLMALLEHDQISHQAQIDLTACYTFLRTLEHRLQMINDEQTQKLPTSPEALDALGIFMGFQSPEDFRENLLNTLLTVEKHYAALFEDEPDLGAGGTLVFTGAEDDVETIRTLTEMGFTEPSHIIGRVKIWHHGRYRSTRSERSRQILTELIPSLLRAFSGTINPDQAFARFDAFLSELPSGVQIFSLLLSNPKILGLVAEIMGNAPRLADWMTRRPILLDGVISDQPGFEQATPNEMVISLGENLSQAADFQDVLDAVRRWANDRRFQIGLRILQTAIDGERAGPVLSLVAETALCGLVPAVEKEFSQNHGIFDEPGSTDSGFAVLAFGKLGGREQAPMSDLDLVFIYRTPPDVSESDGNKPLGPMVYYSRFCQRLMTAITVQTPEGTLYEVDARLRPNGRDGPLGTQFDSFATYYDKDAWTWEFMALTRARVVYGPDGLSRDLTQQIETILRRERDPDKLVVDVDDMRQRIMKQHPGDEPFAIKYRRGGLLDIEFIAQYLQLGHAAGGADILSANTETALDKLMFAGYLDPSIGGDLKASLTLWRNLQAVIRLTAADGFDAEAAPDGQRDLLARVGNLPDFGALQEQVDAMAKIAYRHYQTLVEEPAAEFREAKSDKPD